METTATRTAALPSPTAARTLSAPRWARRRKAILAVTVLLGGAALYAVFLAAVSPSVDQQVDTARPLGYRFIPDDDAPRPHPHLVVLDAWSHRSTAPVAVTLHHRAGAAGAFQAVHMERIGSGSAYAAELQPLPEGQRHFYYFSVRDAAGNEMAVPETAPQAPLYFVRWEGHVNPFVLALHITLMIGALFFLVHALHFSALMLRRRRASGAGGAGLAGKVHRGVLWGWLCFFVGGIPLGIYVSGTALDWSNAWGGWPLGTDITDSKTELLVVYWGAVLVARKDLLRPRLRPLIGDRGLAWLVLGGAVLTAVVYAIPHSLFFQ